MEEIKKCNKGMYQINTKEFADEFCEMVNKIFAEYKYIGDWNWGDPAGQKEGLPTYEIISKKIWYSLVYYY